MGEHRKQPKQQSFAKANDLGTSAAYTPSPNWSGVKTEITNAFHDGPPTDNEAHDIVGDFVQQLCDQAKEGFGDLPADFGSDVQDATNKLIELLRPLPSAPTAGQRTSSTSGHRKAPTTTKRSKQTGGRGGRALARHRGVGGSAVRPVAQRLATFISDVPKVGLRQALLNAGVENIDALPPDRIALAIADVLLADASLLIQAELRAALATVLEKVCDNPGTFEDAEAMLSNSAYDLHDVVRLLFECYIVERFNTLFSEHEANRHGYDAADRILSEARQYVAAEMELEQIKRKDLTAVDWASAQGAKIIDAILERTVAIYTEP